MDKNRIKKGLISASPCIMIAATQLPFVFSEDGFINAIVCGASIGVAMTSYRSGVIRYDFEKLKNSSVYQEYMGLYDEFVNDVANMYKELGIGSGIQSAVVYKICLQNGIFSHDGTDSYTLYEDDKDRLIKGLGGRITTGKYCCRHNASFYSDIVNRMGGLSPKISVYADSKVKNSIFLKPNHLVSGLLHNKRKILIDQTTPLGLMLTKGISYFKDEKALFRKVCENGEGNKYTLVSGYFDNGNVYNDIFEQFMSFDSVSDVSELYDDFLEGLLLGAENYGQFKDFHEEEKPKIMQLSRLSEMVMPHGKEKSKEE